MSDKNLQQIQVLQFKDKEAANTLLKKFLNENLPLNVKEVMVRPLAVSLNSINGFIITEEDEKLFFKTHIEPQSIIDEYYNSEILAKADYPVIKPIFNSTEWGKQLLIYNFFDYPSLFNIIREVENNQRQDSDKIVSIQEKADQELWNIYQKTLETIDQKKNEKAPIHQLFYHRLTGGRFTTFYQGKNLKLPQGIINFDDLAKFKWNINGVEFKHTLNELIQLAIDYLNPSKQDIPSIIGHGDAHNGNIFIDKDKSKLIYFDPAFAGRHSPFLDLAKPLFHNVFAIWMYFPQEVANKLNIKYKIKDNSILIEHDFIPSQVRISLLRSKIQKVLKPLLKELQSRNCFDENWLDFFKMALFCCPFLTMNLSDTNKFPPAITLLGLAMSVEMGSANLGTEKSLLDSEFESIM
ncbi:MAG: hypothetical protein O4808_13565 [Trichodesmium sp. St17_bin3_1_1]|nr:hypothetical protein [Trichodesmium sp. St18_bin1]MDE5108038.1 hypothetical protein [Trichodesmium sp. St17_bin3_1_1]MDE5120917.1 hypothetical protein [Trichodesmium sp. St19_bin1]